MLCCIQLGESFGAREAYLPTETTPKLIDFTRPLVFSLVFYGNNSHDPISGNDALLCSWSRYKSTASSVHVKSASFAACSPMDGHWSP